MDYSEELTRFTGSAHLVTGDPLRLPPVPSSWEADVLAPFTNFHEHVELQTAYLQERPVQWPSQYLQEVLDMLVDPITGSPTKNRKVHGIVSIHVDDAFIAGTP